MQYRFQLISPKAFLIYIILSVYAVVKDYSTATRTGVIFYDCAKTSKSNFLSTVFITFPNCYQLLLSILDGFRKCLRFVRRHSKNVSSISH